MGGVYGNFNPRSREGSDYFLPFYFGEQSIFQSTLPRRERHHKGYSFKYITDISIHAPAKGATTTVHGCMVTTKISIHAPAKGATLDFIYRYSLLCNISIHAPAKGATAIFHKIINLYCKTSTNTTRINSLNINKKYINRIKARILNYFFWCESPYKFM